MVVNRLFRTFIAILYILIGTHVLIAQTEFPQVSFTMLNGSRTFKVSTLDSSQKVKLNLNVEITKKGRALVTFTSQPKGDYDSSVIYFLANGNMNSSGGKLSDDTAEIELFDKKLGYNWFLFIPNSKKPLHKLKGYQSLLMFVSNINPTKSNQKDCDIYFYLQGASLEYYTSSKPGICFVEGLDSKGGHIPVGSVFIYARSVGFR